MILHANIMGEGFPFIILHGFLGMGDNWKTLGRQFSGLGYEVHLVDQRNHGRSFHNDIFNYTELAEDLKKYCDHHNIEQMHLLGHSMGGKTAMFFATKYPDYISKLVIADIAPRVYNAHHNHILESLSELSNNLDALESRKEADKFLESLIPDVGTRQFLLKNLYWKQPGRLGLRVNLPVLVESALQVAEGLPSDRVYTKKTLFLSGDKSDYITSNDHKEINKDFPQAEIRTISNAGHWLHAENPKEFYKEVINFL